MSRFASRASLIATSVATLIGAAVVAACGGGGGGSSLPPPPPPPVPSSSPILNGTAQVATASTYPAFTYAPATSAQVVFSCGCSTQAGTATTDSSGNFTLVANSTPTPSAPNPTYTVVPGRNYIAVATTAAGAEAWNTIFAGSKPSRNLYLNGSNGTSDVFTAAVSLYVYYFSPQEGTGNPGTAFDNWNFHNLVNWYGTLKSSPNGAETQLLNDIASQSGANQTLYPAPPSWNTSHPTNSTIKSDLNSVQSSGDPAIPTPCPTTGCTNTPSP